MLFFFVEKLQLFARFSFRALHTCFHILPNSNISTSNVFYAYSKHTAKNNIIKQTENYRRCNFPACNFHNFAFGVQTFSQSSPSCCCYGRPSKNLAPRKDWTWKNWEQVCSKPRYQGLWVGGDAGSKVTLGQQIHYGARAYYSGQSGPSPVPLRELPRIGRKYRMY